MVDLHTHILPGMDDGAKNPEESLTMLRMQREQGVSTVALTPHFYRDRERPESFLRRREAAFSRLRDALPDAEPLPRMILGAEVTWVPNLCHWENLPEFCLAGTRNLLLELPFTPWSEGMVNQLYDLVNRTGITPVLAHLERYLRIQRWELVEAVLSLEFPVQLSSGVLLGAFTRGSALRMVKEGAVQLLASDCHGPQRRKPDLAAGMDVVRKKIGDQTADQLIRCAESLCGG